mgnify:CR=1 FL=1
MLKDYNSMKMKSITYGLVTELDDIVEALCCVDRRQLAGLHELAHLDNELMRVCSEAHKKIVAYLCELGFYAPEDFVDTKKSLHDGDVNYINNQKNTDKEIIS